jgi:hypothetical protein
MATRDKDTLVLTLGPVTATFRKPEPGQLAVLRRAATLFESGDKTAQGQGGFLFLDVLDALVTDPVILNRIYQGMAKAEGTPGHIGLDQYAQCAIDLIKHFIPAEKAPTTGPVSTRRARSR